MAALESDGAVIVHNFIPQDVLAEFRADVQTAARERHFGSVSGSDLVQFFWGAQTFSRRANPASGCIETPTTGGTAVDATVSK